MSRLRIEALLTALVAACGGATESSNGGATDGTSSSSSSTSSSSSSGSSGASGTSSSGVSNCDSTKPPYTETKDYDLAQACSDYQARQNALDTGTDGDAEAGAFDCASLGCAQLCEVTASANFGAFVWNGTEYDCKKTATQLSCTFHRPCGRRFDGMEEPLTNDVLAGAAYLEAASVIAFEHLARDLAFHEAPSRLIAGALRAGDDERRHTALVDALVDGESPAPNATEWKPRALVDIAIENAVEGCVGETWGALVALAQARDARSPGVRAAYESIAPDEIDHAALAYEIDAWLRPLLTAEERTAVDTAKAAAWSRFEIDIDGDVARALGIPNGDASRRLLASLASAA